MAATGPAKWPLIKILPAKGSLTIQLTMYTHKWRLPTVKTQKNAILYGNTVFFQFYGFYIFWPKKWPRQKIFGNSLALNKIFKIAEFLVNLMKRS